MKTSGHEFFEENYITPGVYFEKVTARRTPGFQTGVPAFLGFAEVRPMRAGQGDSSRPSRLTSWRQFSERFSAAGGRGFLGDAVRGFFDNGGSHCLVVPLPFPEETSVALIPGDVSRALETLEAHSEVDLLCVPDLLFAGAARNEVQETVLENCGGHTGRFAILDPLPSILEGGPGRAPRQQELDRAIDQWSDLPAGDGALYFPWLRARGSVHQWIPPCGHVAGIYARSDAGMGVQKAPANELIEGAVDLELRLEDSDQSRLNSAGVNCLRALPGRGIRVWGARTLHGLPQWKYVNVRRMFLTLVRWVDSALGDLAFEPNNPSLWVRIRARLNALCFELFQKGVLTGASPEQAYYVKCDAETNTLEEVAMGRVIAEIGLAPVLPAEFVVVRIAHSAAGTMLVTP